MLACSLLQYLSVTEELYPLFRLITMKMSSPCCGKVHSRNSFAPPNPFQHQIHTAWALYRLRLDYRIQDL
jgi:hypothetical protein